MALSPFKVLSLTDAAADRVKGIIANSQKPIVGVRVGVKNGGCAGMSYTMEYAETVKPTGKPAHPALGKWVDAEMKRAIEHWRSRRSCRTAHH